MKPLSGKKIICAVTNDLTYDRRMFRICTTLSDAGAEIVLVGRFRKNSQPYDPGNFKGERLKCFFNSGFLFYAEYNIRLMTFLLRNTYAIAVACDLDTALAVRMASRCKGKLSVYDAHEYFSEVPELKDRPGVKRVWERIGKWTIPHFTARYTVGEELARIMGSVYKVPFQVIRNIAPAQVAAQHPRPVEQRNKILLYQGALNVGRGLEACMQAMAQLPDWHWWIAGEGDITEELKQQAKELQVEARVRFFGWVKPEDIPELMQQVRLAINLREADSLNDYYSLPNKFFDAINAGLPSINMDFPEYAAVCKRYACAKLIQNVNVDEIVMAIRHLDQHPETLIAMSNACTEAAREFTWEKESQKLVEIYKGL